MQKTSNRGEQIQVKDLATNFLGSEKAMQPSKPRLFQANCSLAEKCYAM